MDFELRGCPVSKHQLLELILATVAGRKPHVPRNSPCTKCKWKGTTCVTVAHGTPCLGPVTQGRVRQPLPLGRARLPWLLWAQGPPQPSGIAGQEGRFGHGQPQIEEDLHRTVSANLALPDEDLKWLCEQTIRNYAPCICCATHFLKLTVERG